MSEQQKLINNYLEQGLLDKLIECKELGITLNFQKEPLNHLITNIIFSANTNSMKKLLKVLDKEMNIPGDPYCFKPIETLMQLSQLLNNNELINYAFEKSILSSNINLMFELISATKTQPDFSKLTNAVNQFYKSNIKNKNETMLNMMKNYSGIPISTQATDELYSEQLQIYSENDYRLEDTLKMINTIQKLSGNEIPKNEVLKAIKDFKFNKVNPIYSEKIIDREGLQKIKNLSKATKTEIPNEIIREEYNKVINTNCLAEVKAKDLIWLKDELPSNLDTKQLMPLCQELILRDLKLFNELKTKYELSFDDQFYTKKFTELLSHPYDFAKNLNKLLELIDYSGGKLSTDLIKNTHKLLIETGNITELIIFTEKLPINPEFTEYKIQDVYAKMLDNMHYNIQPSINHASFEWIKKKTGEAINIETLNTYARKIMSSNTSLYNKCEILEYASKNTGLIIDYKTLINEVIIKK